MKSGYYFILIIIAVISVTFISCPGNNKKATVKILKAQSIQSESVIDSVLNIISSLKEELKNIEEKKVYITNNYQSKNDEILSTNSDTALVKRIRSQLAILGEAGYSY